MEPRDEQGEEGYHNQEMKEFLEGEMCKEVARVLEATRLRRDNVSVNVQTKGAGRAWAARQAKQAGARGVAPLRFHDRRWPVNCQLPYLLTSQTHRQPRTRIV